MSTSFQRFFSIDRRGANGVFVLSTSVLREGIFGGPSAHHTTQDDRGFSFPPFARAGS